MFVAGQDKFVQVKDVSEAAGSRVAILARNRAKKGGIIYSCSVLHSLPLHQGSLYSSVIYKCLLVNTDFAPGTRTIVYVLSMIIAGPTTTSPTFKLSRRKTGVSSTRARPRHGYPQSRGWKQKAWSRRQARSWYSLLQRNSASRRSTRAEKRASSYCKKQCALCRRSPEDAVPSRWEWKAALPTIKSQKALLRASRKIMGIFVREITRSTRQPVNSSITLQTFRK
ncbi:hypothetical protein B0H14DRAFT_905433 [Mycena olivaceomarginata]|nr:hypothetical protein B0H14DRAFT_905433 [Mycena olivaceomarginata]